MDKIDQLKFELTKLDCNKSDVESQLQSEYNKIFEDSQLLRDALAKLNRSSEYGMKGDEVFAWIRFYASKFEDCRQYLDQWLSNECAVMDWENDALMVMQGGSLIIGTDGDVYDTDSQNVVIQASQYTENGVEDECKRNELIEAWMETNGYFPGVFRADDHGNVFFVNTNKAEK